MLGSSFSFTPNATAASRGTNSPDAQFIVEHVEEAVPQTPTGDADHAGYKDIPRSRDASTASAGNEECPLSDISSSASHKALRGEGASAANQKGTTSAYKPLQDEKGFNGNAEHVALSSDDVPTPQQEASSAIGSTVETQRASPVTDIGMPMSVGA